MEIVIEIDIEGKKRGKYVPVANWCRYSAFNGGG